MAEETVAEETVRVACKSVLTKSIANFLSGTYAMPHNSLMKQKLRLLLVCIIPALIVLALPAAASASVTYSNSWGSYGSGQSQFASPDDVATDQSTGNVYVLDSENILTNDRVQLFDASGNYLTEWGIPGNDPGEFSAPSALTFEDGQLYVSDYGNDRVQVFDSLGGFLYEFPAQTPGAIAVSSNGTIYVSTENGTFIEKHDPGGDLNSTFGRSGSVFVPFSGIADLGVDPVNQQLYVIDSGNTDIQIFSSNGTFQGTWVQSATRMAFSNDTIFLTNQAGDAIDAYGYNQMFEYSITGSGASSPLAAAFTQSSKSLYITSQSGFTVSRFAAIVPTVVVEPTEDITSSSATLKASINPNGDSTTYHFEYGPTSLLGYSTTETSADSGSIDVSVSEAIASLLPGRTYQFKLVTTNSDGANVSAINTFDTEPIGPDATTAAATSITAHEANLNASVNPGGAATAVTFDYGLTTSYTNSTSVVNLPADNTAQPVSLQISGLEPNTTYHYRVAASNAAGEDFGADMTFTTVAIAPDVTTAAASSVLSSTATLNAMVDPNSAATSYHFEWGINTSYGTSTTVVSAGPAPSSVPVSASLTGLVPNTTYHFRISATNASGTSVGLDQSLTTASAAPVATVGAATSITAIGATINGSVNPNHDATTYRFEWGTSIAYDNFTLITSAGSGTTSIPVSASINGLSAGVTYHYKISATNSAGTVSSADQTFMTTPDPPVATSSPATGIGGTGAALNGFVDPKGLSTNTYFEYGTSPAFGSATPTQVITSAQAFNIPVTLSPNTTYYFHMVASNAAATVSSATESFKTFSVGPVISAQPTVTPVTATSVKISVGMNNSGADSNHRIYYGTTQTLGLATPVEFQQASGQNQNVEIVISGLTAETGYYYRYTVSNQSGTAQSAILTFTTSKPGTGGGGEGSAECSTLFKLSSSVEYSQAKLVSAGLYLRLKGPGGGYISQSGAASSEYFKTELSKTARGKALRSAGGTTYTIDGVSASSTSKGLLVKGAKLELGIHKVVATVKYKGKTFALISEFEVGLCAPSTQTVTALGSKPKSATVFLTSGGLSLTGATVSLGKVKYTYKKGAKLGSLKVKIGSSTKTFSLTAQKTKSAPILKNSYVTVALSGKAPTFTFSKLAAKATEITIKLTKSKNIAISKCPSVKTTLKAAAESVKFSSSACKP